MPAGEDGACAFGAGGLYAGRGWQAPVPARHGLAEATTTTSAARAIAPPRCATYGRAAIGAKPAAQFLQLGGGRAAVFRRLRRVEAWKQKAKEQEDRCAAHHGARYGTRPDRAEAG